MEGLGPVASTIIFFLWTLLKKKTNLVSYGKAKEAIKCVLYYNQE